MDIGFEAAGFDVRTCVEKDPYAAATLRANRSSGRKTGRHRFLQNAVILEDDVFELRPAKLLRASRVEPGDLDLVMGGPPCQAFSHAGTREGGSDHRGLLVGEFVRIVREFSPRCAVFENVPGISSAEGGGVLRYLLHELHMLGFSVEQLCLNTADYGVPQLRKRLFVIAHRGRNRIKGPQPTHTGFPTPLIAESLPPFRTVGDALAGLPPASAPGKVAEAIANTIADRKRHQDVSRLRKRTMQLPAHAQAAIEPYRDRLSTAHTGIATDFEAILLYMLHRDRVVRMTARDALRAFANQFDLRLPEKAYSAIYVFGARQLALKGFIEVVGNSNELLRIRVQKFGL
jgi:DNA (cytosine-5)-methyltransferase 1